MNKSNEYDDGIKEQIQNEMLGMVGNVQRN